MLTRPSLIATLLICMCGAALAAPLPLFWPLDVATRELGWRFQREFAVWPGPVVRGPGQPAGAADANVPATWGVLHLSGDSSDKAPEPRTAAWEITAPLVDNRPDLDGKIGWQEWEGAGRVIEPLDDSAEWMLLARRDDTTLFVCLAAPSIFAAHRGQVAEIYLAPAEASPLPLSAAVRVFRLQPDEVGQARLGTLQGDRGHWREVDNSPHTPVTWRGDAAGGGDGAWAYAVFEFAIPLAALAQEGVVPERLLCMARLQVEAHGGAVASPENHNPESVVWPDGRTGYNNATIAALRPASWPRLALGPAGEPDDLQVPRATQPIRVDGELSAEEWQGAWSANYALSPGQWRRVMLARDGENLYVAVRLHVARGVRKGEICRVYVDPRGDGGLTPGSDDLMYRVTLGSKDRPETFRYKLQEWRQTASGDITAAGGRISGRESCYELALPLQLFGPTPAPRMAVEVSYRIHE
jgi:hypothetical protein